MGRIAAASCALLPRHVLHRRPDQVNDACPAPSPRARPPTDRAQGRPLSPLAADQQDEPRRPRRNRRSSASTAPAAEPAHPSAAPSHTPSTRSNPSASTPAAPGRRPRSSIRAAVPDLDHQRVDVQEWRKRRRSRPVPPFSDLVGDHVGRPLVHQARAKTSTPADLRQVRANVPGGRPARRPRESDRIISSTWPTRRCPFPTICGSNADFRSRGTAIRAGPRRVIVFPGPSEFRSAVST